MLKISIAHWELDALAKNHPDKYEELRKLKEGAQLGAIKRDDAGKITGIEGYGSFEAFVNTPEDLPDWMIEKVSWAPIKPLKMLTERGDIITENLKTAFSRSQVHLPHNHLLDIEELQVVLDSCTNAINEEIRRGWQILAILPQHGQRRPDYILGRQKHNQREESRDSDLSF